MTRAVVAAACALALALGGCGTNEPPPPEQVALALGQELRSIDSALLGLVEQLPEASPNPAEYAALLWGRATRAEAEVRGRVELQAPAGEPLRRAAAAQVRAAALLHRAAAGGEPVPQAALEHLATANVALAQAATALEARLPPSADGPLQRLRRAPSP